MRLINTTGLKVQYIPNSNRLKVTQMNCNKSVYVICKNIGIIDYISLILNDIDVIKNYSVLVDNTQSRYYIFNLDFYGKSFINILNSFI